MKLDIVVDLRYGDCGKGKIVHSLLSKDDLYTHVIRTSGGSNCGHSIYHNNKKFVTHAIPAGVFYGKRSIIGPGCVIHPQSFLEEIKYLEDNGIKCRDLIKISGIVNVVTNKHLAEDAEDTIIGTTKKGIGQCYRDKYARVGIEAKTINELQHFIIDFYQEFYQAKSEPIVLAEGAQGFFLDPHWGQSPYVTSSHCTVAGALVNGFAHKAVRNVYGVCKAYDTYVGNKKFQPDDEIFNLLQRTGQELGATTGRKRQCNFLNLTELRKAVQVNGISHLIINKMDILQQLNCWKVINDGKVVDLTTEQSFKDCLMQNVDNDIQTIFSYSPNDI